MKLQSWQRDLMETIQNQGLRVMVAGCGTGKSQWHQVAKTMARMMEKDLKIQWERLGNNQLRAVCRSDNTHFDLLQESDMDPIQDWCFAHNCGARTSFDTFKFQNKKQITMFLLRWA